MAIWIGCMPSAHLNDVQIRTSEYRKWAHAVRRFTTGDDRKTIDAYKHSIQEAGRLPAPIRLSIDDRTHETAIGDGHHRAIAVLESGLPVFDFTWGWRRAFSNTTEHGPFPFHLHDWLQA